MSNLLSQDKKKNFLGNSAFIKNKSDTALLRNFGRKDAVKIARLISGYVADEKYMFKIKRAAIDLCVCGELNALEHALWQCEQNEVARFQLKSELTGSEYNYTNPHNLKSILASRNKQEIKAIIEFFEAVQ